MKEYIFKAKCRFLFNGKTYKRNEIIIANTKRVSREFGDHVEFLGEYNG